MQGKKVLITGSTDGIGKATAIQLARMNAHVLIHGRSQERCRHTVDQIKSLVPKARLDYFCFDLSSLKEVCAFADAVKSGHQKLHVLINNAGVYMNHRHLSADGYEMTFAVNHLAHFLLTALLLPLLKEGSPSRVINVSSVAHQNAKIDFKQINAEKGYSGYHAYASSKLANILFTYALARRVKEAGITSNAMHPGVISTKLLHSGFGPGGLPVDKGAKTAVYLASSPMLEGITGKYFDDRHEAHSSALSYDKQLQEELWMVSEVFCRKAADIHYDI